MSKEQTPKPFAERLREFMISDYDSYGSAESFVKHAEGVLEFCLKEMKSNDPSAKMEISSLEMVLDYLGGVLDANEALEELEKES